MIYKSYLIEEDINILKNNFCLIYGENIGLRDDLREKIKNEIGIKNIIKFSQDEILKNENIIINEIFNASLFDEKKCIFIDDVNDKILDLTQQIDEKLENDKVFLFTNILEKKSKLRSYFEKSKTCGVIPCYKDNELTLKKLVLRKLKGYTGLTPEILNLLLDNCGLNRMKLNNEIKKVANYFINKSINIKEIDELLNIKSEEEFDIVKNNALKGNASLTNKLLSTTVFEMEKIPLYINLINQRLIKLKEVAYLSKEEKIDEVINTLKPPIFWKDKPDFLNQAKLWNLQKINAALIKTYDIELNIKSNANINKNLLIKKLIIDICMLANA